MEILRTIDLSVGYAAKKNLCLFKNLNLALKTGQLVCFMGPNGVGKSTLIRTLAGLQKSLAGSVKISTPTERNAGSPITTPETISVVLTDRITAHNMTVYELVTHGRYPYLDWHIKLSDEDIDIVNKAIDQIHIQHLADKKLYELSDGQMQMVMIARALAQNTPIILLDEPTAHLDLNNRVEIMKLLKELTRLADKAILIATHDLDLALQTADHIWLSGKEKDMITGIPEDLVLEGVFDEIFEFKGFDLKTGKVQHLPHRNIKVQLHGEDYPFLWTKNALERNGFEINAQLPDHTITLQKNNHRLTWLVDQQLTFHSISDLLNHLTK